VAGRQTIRRALNLVPLVVSNFLPVLRGRAGRNPGEKIEHDQAKIGVSVRVSGNSLGLHPASKMPITGTRTGKKF